MRRAALILAAILAVVVVRAAPTMAEPAEPSKPTAAPPTPLSGVEVAAPRRKPTTVSELEVVARRATPVSELDVTAPLCPDIKRNPGAPAPKLVSSFPADGAVVRPGVLVLRLTFNQPMTCGGLLDGDFPLTNPCPRPLQEPLFSRDRRTFLTVCNIRKRARYGLRLEGFTSLAGQPLPTGDVWFRELTFRTSNDAEVATEEEAIDQDVWLVKAEEAAEQEAEAERVQAEKVKDGGG